MLLKISLLKDIELSEIVGVLFIHVKLPLFAELYDKIWFELGVFVLDKFKLFILSHLQLFAKRLVVKTQFKGTFILLLKYAESKYIALSDNFIASL